jgi:acetyl-CoA acetyltransferase
VMRGKPITIEIHQQSRFIAEPLHLFDYCLINDGAACLIMTTAQRARDCAKIPVLLAGVGSADSFAQTSIPGYDPDHWYSAVQRAGDASYRMADIGPKDVDALMCYDNFSPTVLFALEGLGFCPRGEGGRFVEGGTLRLGGALPTNTDGGHLSNSYTQGWSLNVEAVRQLRGECGDRQVQGCEVVQYVAATPGSRSIIYTRGG